MRISGYRSGLLVCFTIVLFLAVASSASATDTKHSATSGSLLIPSSADFDAFPCTMLGNDGFVDLNTGVTQYGATPAGSSDGSLRLVTPLSEKWALQVQAHNQSFGARVLNYAWGGTLLSPAAMAPSAFAGQIMDLDVATSLGEQGNLSVGLGLGSYEGPVGELPEGFPANTTFKSTAVAIRASGANPDGKVMVGGEVLALPEKFTVPAAGSSPETEYDQTLVSTAEILKVGFSPEWTAIGAFYLNQFVTSFSSEKGGAFTTDHAIGVLGSIGKTLVATDETRACVEGFVDYRDKVTVQSGSKSAPGKVTQVPGVRVGVTHRISRFVELMGGARGSWLSASADLPEEQGGGKISFKEFHYDYTLGIGLDFGKSVRLDMQVHPEAVPKLASLGNNSTVLAAASLEVGF